MHACLVTWLCLTLCDLMGCSPPGFSGGILQARILEGCPPPEDLPDPGIKPASLAWQMISVPLSHLGSPRISNPILEYVVLSLLTK